MYNKEQGSQLECYLLLERFWKTLKASGMYTLKIWRGERRRQKMVTADHSLQQCV